MQTVELPVDEGTRRRDRDEIIGAMGRMLEQMREERTSFEQRLNDSGETAAAAVEQAVERSIERGDEHYQLIEQKIDEKVSVLQQETAASLQRIEEKVDTSYGLVEKKVDMSSKAIQSMVTIAICSFGAVTLAIVLLFVVLLTNL